jgi:hypothetical protein
LKLGQRNGNTHKLLATEMDYLRSSTSISRMDRIRSETIGTKMEIKKDITQGTGKSN